jgi:2'-5' RNA ligase
VRRLNAKIGRNKVPTLLYQGHGSYRLTANDGRVIYVDPYAGGGYDAPADVILVTHGHGDHNKTELVTQKSNCRVITNVEALSGGNHNMFDLGGGLIVEAVEAKNIMHSPKKCVGYIVTIDGVTLYCSGDTSKTEQMKSFAARELDYALLPLDGIANMGLKKGAECANLIGAKHNIPIHLKPGALFNRKKADKWGAPNKLIIEPGKNRRLDYSMRLFIAINFNDDTRSRLLALRDELRGKSESGNFSEPSMLHLTLAFLGECDGKQIVSTKSAVSAVSFEPFDITVDCVGRFKRDGGDIWWAGLREDKPLMDVQRELTKFINSLSSIKFNLETRKFSPHITLGREIVTDAKPWNIAPFGETIGRIDLMKSERIGGNVTHKTIYYKKSE